MNETLDAVASQETEACISEKPKKKWSKKKIWLVVLCSVFAALLIAGILIYIFIINSPLYKIYQAALNTKERLDEILQNGKNLTAWVDSVKQTYESGRFTVDLDYAKPETKLQMQLHYGTEEKALAGALTYHLSNQSTLDADFSANDKELMFRFPNILNKTFSVPLENLGTNSASNSYFSEYLPDWVQALDGLDPDLFTDISWQTYQETHEDEIDDLIDSIEIDEVNEQIEHASGLTTYRMTLDSELFTELFLGYLHHVHDTRIGAGRETSLNKTIDWFEKLLLGKELTFYVGIDRNDCLSALHLRAQKQGEKASTLTIVLSGEENPWNSFGLWIDGEEKWRGGLTAENDGFTLQINRYSLRSTDSQRALVLQKDEATKLTMRYDTVNERNGATVVYGEKSWNVGLAPYRKKVSMISSSPKNLFDMGFFDWLEVIAALVEHNLL